MNEPSPAHDVVASSAARRPLKSRETGWARVIASWLTKHGATPNSISVFSMVFAFVGGVALVATRFFTQPWVDAVLFLIAIVGVQGRLLCNLFDGMVAVEGGRKTPAGPIYNEAPDRVADTIILLAAGYAAEPVYGPTLGWAAALLAMLTAYIRVLGTSVGAGTYFIGPFAKQQRMATITLACVVAAVVVFFAKSDMTYRWFLSVALAIICVGCVPTTLRRLCRILTDLRTNTKPGNVA